MANNPTLTSVINLGLPAVPPDFITDPQVKALAVMMIQTFNNLLGGIEQFDGFTQKDVTRWSTLQPTDTLFRQNVGRLYVETTENLAFGAFVNLFNNGGVLGARNSSSSAKPACGYCNVTGGALVGDSTEVILSQGILAVTGLNPGQAIYLANTPGLASVVPDTAVGRIEQFLGIGVAPGIAYIDISLGQYVQH